MSFEAEVWQTFREYDVTRLIEKNGKVEYITWARIWEVIMNLFPESHYHFQTQDIGNELQVDVPITVEIACFLSIVRGDDCVTRSIHLPVMQSHVPFSSIENPTSRDISDSKMRALVKCAAIHGLGLTLWTKEDHMQYGDKILDHAKLKSEYRMTLWAAAIVIKGAFAEEVPSVAVEAYVELSDDEKGWLLLAETKGGYLTQAEKTWLKEQHYLEYKADE